MRASPGTTSEDSEVASRSSTGVVHSHDAFRAEGRKALRYPEGEASSNMRLISFPLVLLLPISAPGQQPQQPPSRDVNFYTLEKETAIGKVLAEDFRRRVSLVDDADLRAYTTKIVTHLNEFAQRPFPITIEISESADFNADVVGLPGGHLFVPLRLLASAQDEAELARPVAHAMAHIAIRQATRLATQGQIANLTTVPLIFIGDWAHDHHSRLIPLVLRKFQEEQEAHVDRLATDWVGRSGFADGTFETGEFATMHDRARGMAQPKPQYSAPPSFRRRPQ